MKKYGFINNLGELKIIQTSIYKGEGNYVGITRNGWAYIYLGNESKRLTREELISHLNLTPEQVDSVIRSRGKIEFDSSKGNGEKPVDIQSNVEKFEITQQVKAEKKDTQVGREMSDAKASVDAPSEVEFDKEPSGAVSLDKSEIKSLSLKNQVKYLRNRVKWFEDNYVSKDQMIEILQTILQEK